MIQVILTDNRAEELKQIDIDFKKLQEEKVNYEICKRYNAINNAVESVNCRLKNTKK